jgi:Protein of unknown function (DUF2442)
MDQFEQEIEHATKRASDRLARDPRAVAAHYDANRDALVIGLSTGADVAFPRGRIQGLTRAASDDLAEIEISPSGYGLHFPKVDADLWVPALLEGVFGSRTWMAAQLGAQGGKSTSEAKAQAARANGKRGGRPVKRGVAKKKITGGVKGVKRGVKGAQGVKAKKLTPAERRAALRARREAAAARKPSKRKA